VGLKENVIIGKLIPAGSGLMAYRDYQPGITPEARVLPETVAEASEEEWNDDENVDEEIADEIIEDIDDVSEDEE
jgi:DNA-directed RNA polymerase subunit beta'